MTKQLVSVHAGHLSAARWLATARFVPTPIANLMSELSLYSIVSVVALAIDLSVFNVMLLGSTPAAWAGVIGYSAGGAIHYVLSKRYVFVTADAAKSGPRRFAEFGLTGGAGIMITWSVMRVATDLAHLPALVGKLAAIAISFAVVYALRRRFVFAGEDAEIVA
jgi:putative flippase GtrA